MKLMPIVAFIVLGGIFPANAYTCEEIRAHVAQIGLQAARAEGRAQGITPDQERQAMSCLGGKTHGRDRLHRQAQNRSRSAH
jgi:hypothetical protein